MHPGVLHDMADAGAGGQYLNFTLEDEDFGLDILKVAEIRGSEAVRPLPATPEYVKGVLDMRGTLVPIIDLRLRLGVGKAVYASTTVIIVVSGLLLANALLSAREALIPVTGDYPGLHGLVQLMQTLRAFQPLRSEALKHWIVLSRFQPRQRPAREVQQRLQKHFAASLLIGTIPEAAVLAECPDLGRSIFEYRGGSRSAHEFQALARELVHRREWMTPENTNSSGTLRTASADRVGF